MIVLMIFVGLVVIFMIVLVLWANWGLKKTEEWLDKEDPEDMYKRTRLIEHNVEYFVRDNEKFVRISKAWLLWKREIEWAKQVGYKTYLECDEEIILKKLEDLVS